MFNGAYFWLLLLACHFAQGVDVDACKSFDIDSLDHDDDKDYCWYQIERGILKKGDICFLNPRDAVPTQSAIGLIEANCKRDKIMQDSKDPDKFWSYLIKEQHWVPGVLGPSNSVNGTDAIYIVDHHHLSRGLFDSYLDFKDIVHHRVMFTCVIYDYSDQDLPDFWKTMETNKLVWLHDERGQQIEPSQLPHYVAYMLDDPYRSLSEWVRDSHGYIKCGRDDTDDYPQCKGGAVQAPPFLEYIWADLFRQNLTLPSIYHMAPQDQIVQLESMLEEAIELALAHQDMPGANKADPSGAKPIDLDDKGCEVD